VLRALSAQLFSSLLQQTVKDACILNVLRVNIQRHQQTHEQITQQHRSYRSSIVKFPSFQVVEWQFPWRYRNNNPITQTLDYILRFIITMKHVIYGAILSAARGSGERCKLPQWGLERSPSRKRIWCMISALKSDIWWHQFQWFSWEPIGQISCMQEHIFPDHS